MEELNAVGVYEDDEAVEPDDGQLKFKFSWRKLWAFTGPGWLMSLAYLDPGNLEADLQQGAYTRYSLLWVLLWATALGLLLQEMAARLGVVSGKALAEMGREVYPRRTSYMLYVMMELAIVGSDIQEVLGSAIGLNILFGVPLWLGCLVTGLDTFTFLAVHHLGVRKLEALVTTLVFTMAVCFFINWGEAETNGADLLYGLVVPTMKPYMLTQAVGTIGAVVMPHNLYLHSGLVKSRTVDRKSPSRVHEAIRYNLIESALALAVSFFINVAVVATFADFFYSDTCAPKSMACVPAGAVDDDDFDRTCSSGFASGTAGVCAEIGLAVAAPALRHAMGGFGRVMWGVGLLAAGQASTMTATFAGQMVMQGFLDLNLAPWVRVAVTRAAALGPAVVVALSTAHNAPLQNRINEWLNILQSLQLPFAMVPLLYITSRSDIMGRFKNGGRMSLFAYAVAVLILVINVALVVQFVLDKDTPIPHGPGAYAVALGYGVLYFWFISWCVPDLFRRGPARDATTAADDGYQALSSTDGAATGGLA